MGWFEINKISPLKNVLTEDHHELKKKKHIEGLKNTVEPRFNKPLFNKVLDITNDILCPSQSYSKMYGVEPRYNERWYNKPRYNKPWYNEFFDITNIIQKPKCKNATEDKC